MAEAELVRLDGPAPGTSHRALKDIAYGSIAGIVSKAFEHPLDLVKVRLQSQPLDQPLRFNGPLDCMVQTFKGEGVKGLWRGVSMPIGGAMAENATLFVVYNKSQAFLRGLYPPIPTLATEPAPLAIPQMALSAALAGACASFVLTPVELVKCKMQVQAIVTTDTKSSSSTPRRTPGPIAITRGILRQEGLKGLWLGQTGTLIRETGGSAAWFTTFEVLVSYFISRRSLAGERGASGIRVEKGDLSAVELMGAGAAAGVMYNCVLFPADCIKSTIQTEDELRGLSKGGGVRRSFMEVGKDIYRARGVRGLYSGCGLTALRAAPSSAMIFYIYSRLESYFG